MADRDRGTAGTIELSIAWMCMRSYAAPPRLAIMEEHHIMHGSGNKWVSVAELR
jgi:hypothetical protein